MQASAPLFVACALVLAAPAAAETELSFYTGYQTAPHSDVSGTDPENGGPVDFTAKWLGKSFSPPPYYGMRAIFWRSQTFGWGPEYTHSKVYADGATLAANNYDRFELTDGMNILTVNAYRRWPQKWGKLTPYVGAGIGIAVPDVDIQPTGGTRTKSYQLTGPAVRWEAGVSYAFNNRWSGFAAYQGTYSMHHIELNTGGNFETNIITNAINIGVSYSF